MAFGRLRLEPRKGQLGSPVTRELRGLLFLASPGDALRRRFLAGGREFFRDRLYQALYHAENGFFIHLLVAGEKRGAITPFAGGHHIGDSVRTELAKLGGDPM